MDTIRNIIFFICFLIYSLTLNSQVIDSLQIQISTDWRTEGEWFGSEYIILKPIRKFDLARLDSLSKYEQAIKLAKFQSQTMGEGERISFYKNQKMKYSYSLRCSVGELIRKLKEFRLKNGIVYTKYEVVTWESNPFSKGVTNYEVLNWTKDSITLKKKNH